MRKLLDTQMKIRQDHILIGSLLVDIVFSLEVIWCLGNTRNKMLLHVLMQKQRVK